MASSPVRRSWTNSMPQGLQAGSHQQGSALGRAGGARWSCATGQTRELCQPKARSTLAWGYKRLRDKPPKAQDEQQQPAEAQ
ncbi:hypothetical protein HaLaN_13334, partial [Haematococcus lacustris]